MPDLIVTPTVQSLTVSPTTQSLTVDALPALTINNNLPLTYAANQINSNVSVSSAAFTALTSIPLTAGTWIIWGEVELYHTAAFVGAARISDLLGNTIIAGGEGTIRAAGFSLHLSISGVVSLASAETIYLMARGDTTITARASTNVNSLAGCTNIKAVKVAL